MDRNKEVEKSNQYLATTPNQNDIDIEEQADWSIETSSQGNNSDTDLEQYCSDKENSDADESQESESEKGGTPELILHSSVHSPTKNKTVTIDETDQGPYHFMDYEKGIDESYIALPVWGEIETSPINQKTNIHSTRDICLDILNFFAGVTLIGGCSYLGYAIGTEIGATIGAIVSAILFASINCIFGGFEKSCKSQSQNNPHVDSSDHLSYNNRS